MDEFEFHNGVVRIGDDSIEITSSPMYGVKLWYRESKTSVLLVVLAVVAMALIERYRSGAFVRLVGFGLLFAVGFLFVYFLLSQLDVVGPPTTINRDSVVRVEYSTPNSVRASKITIIYNDDGEEKARDIFTSLPITSGQDRLERAVTAVGESGIDVVAADGSGRTD